MTDANTRRKRNNALYIFWTVFFVVGMFLFLIYGLSFFASKPTIETITTDAPQFDSNNQPMRNAKFQTIRKKR